VTLNITGCTDDTALGHSQLYFTLRGYTVFGNKESSSLSTWKWGPMRECLKGAVGGDFFLSVVRVGAFFFSFFRCSAVNVVRLALLRASIRQDFFYILRSKANCFGFDEL